MYFLLLFNEGVVLRDTPESKFIHEVNFIRVLHVFIGEGLYGDWESRAEKHDLAVARVELQKLLNYGSEFGGEEFVCFVHDKHRTFAEVGHILSCQVKNSTGSANDDVDGILETNNVIS